MKKALSHTLFIIFVIVFALILLSLPILFCVPGLMLLGAVTYKHFRPQKGHREPEPVQGKAIPAGES